MDTPYIHDLHKRIEALRIENTRLNTENRELRTHAHFMTEKMLYFEAAASRRQLLLAINGIAESGEKPEPPTDTIIFTDPNYKEDE